MQAVQAVRPAPTRLFTALSLALIVSACAPMPKEREAPTRPTGPTEPRALEEAGRFEDAARAWEDLAVTAPGEQASSAWLNASRDWVEAGRLGAARDALSRADSGRSLTSAADYALTIASLRLAEGRSQAADDLLRDLPDALPRALRIRTLELRAEAAFRLQRPQDAVTALLELAEVDPDMGSDRVQSRIWQGLSLPYPDPSVLIPDDEAPPVVRAWLDLAQVVRSARQERTGLQASLDAWQDRHPRARIDPALLDRIVQDFLRRMSYPDHVALLLPLSGRLEAPGTAVRDGFMAGLLAHPDGLRPRVSMFDTAELGPLGAYYAARDAGVDLIVGPLSKENVAQVASARSDVPVLALNYLPDGSEPPEGAFFQYSLSPEDEAIQAAERVLRDGHRTGIALMPQDEFGGRMLGAFQDRLEELDGLLLTWQAYDPDLSDYSRPIKTALLLDQSESRHRSLERITGLDLEFEPRRRRDVAFIYLVAEPRQARLIRPQLRFHYATDLPVYATSDAYEPDPQRNVDLQGVIFSEMPWTVSPDPFGQRVQSALAEHWRERISGRDRLVAMGIDAFDLIPSLLNGEDPLAEPLPGQTGLLSMDADGRIHRRLHWARIVGGEARLDERGWETLLRDHLADAETAARD